MSASLTDRAVNVFTVNVKTFEASEPEPAVPCERGSSGRGERRPAMAATRTIMMVDDDRDLVASVQAYLGARGYRVEAAYNGTEAREILAAARPDLFVLDVMMDTDTEGLNLAHELHETPETHGIPIVLLSGFTKELGTKTNVFEPLMYREWPAAKFLEKPVKLAELAETVDRLLGAEAAGARA
jgi:CheY-like chemotaxis protein